MLCERGILPFELHRNTLDFGHFRSFESAPSPVLVVESRNRGATRWRHCNARGAAGADVLLIEVRQRSDHALSDAPALYLTQFDTIMRSRIIATSSGGVSSSSRSRAGVERVGKEKEEGEEKESLDFDSRSAADTRPSFHWRSRFG